jgi:hypothetical protein
MIDTIATALATAILLSLSGTLLGRAKEIDLSLDTQCFFVAGLQDCLFKVTPTLLAVPLSVVLLFLLLCLRLVFARRFRLDPMIVSIGFGLTLLGATYTIFALFGLAIQSPQYQRWASFWCLVGVAAAFISTALLADRYFAPSQRVRVPLKSLGGPPGFWPSVGCSIAPACVLTAISGTLLATHAGTVTPNSSSAFGVLGSTAALLTYGRSGRAVLAGLVLAGLYLLGIFAGTSAMQDLLQSFVLPIVTLIIAGALALFLGRA